MALAQGTPKHSTMDPNESMFPKFYCFVCLRGFPDGSDGKASVYNAGDPGSIPGSGRSSREGNGDPLQYSCLENPMDGGAWWATVHGAQRVGCDWTTSLSLCPSALCFDLPTHPHKTCCVSPSEPVSDILLSSNFSTGLFYHDSLSSTLHSP